MDEKKSAAFQSELTAACDAPPPYGETQYNPPPSQYPQGYPDQYTGPPPQQYPPQGYPSQPYPSQAYPPPVYPSQTAQTTQITVQPPPPARTVVVSIMTPGY